ncbi:F0F1 ATP synthase subunit delta [Ligilactobacillus sp. WILCCON 0076]|uniref:ATP synthase subunit delta n=1 Tax=Ligilactobacillus ubinensis TaxID=2876789 RepID=A0A9X2JK33_9LACO|nr:ATP synthase F1 subunit delta [Ligilactobacillus ubinensis]MCP0885958.1 F0F1 ATP synthase subunit delta [Ligilactobacillus ubinensis]
MALDNSTIAHRYSQALFEVAQEKKQLENISAELAEVKKGIATQPQFTVFMTSPSINYEAKLALLESLTKNASELTKNLLNMLFDYNRIANLNDVINEFNKLYDEFQKTVRVTVTTAIKLDDIQTKKLSDSFANIVNAKNVVVKPVVDSTIIGGVILQSNSYIYDGSIKTKIERIKRLLLK